ncbi:ATP-binding protein [Nonomuraea sp. NPDC050643]|uniref:ATP-binding protein n=1 Tax=Nonomuraea sp. NPDC050643 TaxID=3155660 RepID=UPI0033F58863
MNSEFELRCPISANLELIRRLVRAHARQGGLRGERLDDLVFAVNEAVTNVLDHGAGSGLVIARTSAHATTVDIVDPAGRLSAHHLTEAQGTSPGSGRFGLWVIQRLCDRVELEQSDQGSRLRLHMHHTGPRPYSHDLDQTGTASGHGRPGGHEHMSNGYGLAWGNGWAGDEVEDG